MIRWAKSVADLVGHTPLIELERFKTAAGGTVATLLAKLEMFNPGGSSKDRVALQMICEAEAQGLLRPGSTIIEPTSGNMGISLACIASARGYNCILTMPDTVSLERRLLLQRLAQTGHAHPEVLHRPILRALGPEGARQPGALDLSGAAEGQEREEPALLV